MPRTRSGRLALLLRSRKLSSARQVAYQLAGTKKVQQALAAPGVIEKWLPSDAESLRGVFAGLYSLDVAVVLL